MACGSDTLLSRAQESVYVCPCSAQLHAGLAHEGDPHKFFTHFQHPSLAVLNPEHSPCFRGESSPGLPVEKAHPGPCPPELIPCKDSGMQWQKQL